MLSQAPGWGTGLMKSTNSQPYPGRTVCHNGVLGLSRLLFFLLGFLRIRVRGQRASRLEAPVLVAAPHSTFFDPIVLLPCDLPKVVSRAENLSVPVIGGERVQEREEWHKGEEWQPRGPKKSEMKTLASSVERKVRRGTCLLADECKLTPVSLSTDLKALRAGARDKVLERTAYSK